MNALWRARCNSEYPNVLDPIVNTLGRELFEQCGLEQNAATPQPFSTGTSSRYDTTGDREYFALTHLHHAVKQHYEQMVPQALTYDPCLTLLAVHCP